jgi:hypothetical protein
MTLRVMEAATGKVIRTLKFDLGVQSVSFSPDSRFLAVGSLDWKARVVDAVTGQEISTLEFDQSVTSVSFSPDGCFLAAASPDRTTRVAEVATGKEIWRLEGYILANSVSFSADGRFLAVASADRTARVFDCTWFKLREEMSAHWRSALLMQSSRQFLPDGRLAQLSADELLAAQHDLTAFVSVEPKPDQRWQHAILKWSQMPVDQRTTSPWTTETIRTVIGYQLMQVDLEGTDTRSANSAPWHPLAPVSLARLEPRSPPGGTTIFPPGTIDPIVRSGSVLLTRGKPGSYGLIGEPAQGTTRIIFLARLTLKRLRDADEKLYGREPLAEYAAWAAKIMHEELHCEAEALEAVNFALERTPKDKQENLLELKARLAPTK